MSFITLNCDLLSFIITWKSHKFLKFCQNYILNDINDIRPFPLHEQSWHRAALLKNITNQGYLWRKHYCCHPDRRSVVTSCSRRWRRFCTTCRTTPDIRPVLLGLAHLLSYEAETVIKTTFIFKAHSHQAKAKFFFDICRLFFHLFFGLFFDHFCFRPRFRLVWIGL